MSDQELRQLERSALAGDPIARYLWRCALVRAGRARDAGLEPGDVCRELHREDPALVTIVSERKDWNGAAREFITRKATGTIARGTAVEDVLELVQPFDPSTSRALLEPPKRVSNRRLEFRAHVRALLLMTWCLGASEEETRWVLKSWAPPEATADWAHLAWWSEARDFTGWETRRQRGDRERAERRAAREAAKVAAKSARPVWGSST